jgi:hypothetical protein
LKHLGQSVEEEQTLAKAEKRKRKQERKDKRKQRMYSTVATCSYLETFHPCSCCTQGKKWSQVLQGYVQSSPQGTKGCSNQQWSSISIV